MPVFGEYETLGEPVAVTEERGHTSRVWQGRLVGSKDGRLFAIKCYLPRPRRPKPGESEDALDKDRGLEFLDAVKQLKKAFSEGGRCLSPVHSFGIAPEGAWYVTDFYPGKTLKELIVRRGRVDNAALGHVVRSVVTACLALKRSRGYSHGNLKASNVFLVGKPRALSKRPIQLGDPYPASATQLASLEDQDRKAVGDLLNQTVEAQDLRALGELLLQLVRGRLIASASDFDYPIARSPAWDNLGKEGETWRELCNQLLSPQLALDCVSLELLEKKFTPTVDPAKLKVAAIAAGAIILVGGALYVRAMMVRSNAQKNFKEHDHLAETAMAATNLIAAQKEINLALTFDPRDAAAVNSAKELKAKIEQRLEEYTRALTDARKEYRAGNPGPAAKRLADASALYPEGALIPAEREYGEALTQARNDFQAQQWDSTIANANRVLAVEKTDEDAMKMKTEAESRLALLANKELMNKELTQKLADGERLLGQDKYPEAESSFKRAAELASQVKDNRQAEAESQARYAGLLTSAETARKAGAGHEAEEFSALEKADGIKKAAKVTSWLGEARTRQDAAKNLQTMRSDLAKTMSDGASSLEQEKYADAEQSFKRAIDLAGQLKDNRLAEATSGQQYAALLNKADAARKAGAGHEEEEASALEKAEGMKKIARISTWLREANQRRDAAKSETQKRTDLAKALSDGAGALAQEKYGDAEQSYKRAADLAVQLKDPRVAEAQGQQQYAGMLNKADTAKKAGLGHEADEISALQQAEALKKVPKITAWLGDAQKRQTLRGDLDKALASGADSLKQDKYAEAEQSYKRAADFAAQLKDVRQIEATNQQQYASLLSQADVAKRAGTGHEAEEVKALQAAEAMKKVPKITSWYLDASNRLDLVKNLATSQTELTKALADGAASLGQDKYGDAEQNYRRAAELAGRLKDPRLADAQTQQQYAGLLTKAETAKKAGFGHETEEVTALQSAEAIKKVARITSWLGDARRRQDQAVALETTRADIGAAMTNGQKLLALDKYSEAEGSFKKAADLAGQIKDNRQADAQTQQQYAGLLTKADVAKKAGAGHESEEVNALQSAEKIKTAPKVAAWLVEATKRQGQAKAMETARADLTKVLSDGQELLTQEKYTDAEAGFKHAVELATQAKDNRLADAQGQAKYAGLLNTADVARKAGLGHESEEVSALDAAEAMKKVLKITGWLADARKRQQDTTTKVTNFDAWLASAQEGVKSKTYGLAYKAATDAYALASNTPALFPRDKADAANRLAFSIVTNACIAAIEGADGDEAAAWAQKAKSYQPQGLAFATAVESRISALPKMPREIAPFHGITFVRVGTSPTANRIFYASKHEITAGQLKDLAGLGSAGPDENVPADCAAWKDATDFCSKMESSFNAQCSSGGVPGIKSGKIRLPSLKEYLKMAQIDESKYQVTTNFIMPAADYNEIKKTGELMGLGDFAKAQNVFNGHTNSLELVNVLGNVPEWTDDGLVFGFTYATRGVGSGRRLLNTTTPVSGTVVGLRPVLIPEQ